MLTVDHGGSVQAKKLVGDGLNKALIHKLIEEAEELKKSELSVEEIADLQEIIDQLCRNLKITHEELVKIQKVKRDKNGGFEDGNFVEMVTLPADDRWAKYYASDPERFPEIM